MVAVESVKPIAEAIEDAWERAEAVRVGSRRCIETSRRTIAHSRALIAAVKTRTVPLSVEQSAVSIAVVASQERSERPLTELPAVDVDDPGNSQLTVVFR